MNRRLIRTGLLLAGLCTLAAGCGGGDGDGAGRPTINVAVYGAGKQGAISGPLYYWKDEWEKQSGARLNIVEIPYAQIYERVMADARAGGGEFDGVVIPAFMYGDLIEADYIMPIGKFKVQEQFPKWSTDTIVAPIARLLVWKGAHYGCPNDGDAQILYYRKDVLNDPEYVEAFEKKTGKRLSLPPRTWDDVAEIAEFFRGVDWNGNGADDEYSFTMHLKGGAQGYWHYMSLSAPYVVLPGNGVTRYRNVYAFDPETMEPIIDSPGHVRGLEMLRRLAATGDKAQVEWGLEEAWDRFLKGKALFCFSWGDLGRLAQEPERSTVKGKLGCCALPGTMEVWDRETQRWAKLATPNDVGNTCGASWHGVVCKSSKRPDLVYHLFAFHASQSVNMLNVAKGWSGIDPCRTFHFLQPRGAAILEDYTNEGFDANDVQEFTSAYYENYNRSDAMLEYLRIPGATRFYTALDEEISRGMADTKVPAEQVMKRVAQKWRTIVKDLERELGPGRLLTLYQESIGYDEQSDR